MFANKLTNAIKDYRERKTALQMGYFVEGDTQVLGSLEPSFIVDCVDALITDKLVHEDNNTIMDTGCFLDDPISELSDDSTEWRECVTRFPFRQDFHIHPRFVFDSLKDFADRVLRAQPFRVAIDDVHTMFLWDKYCECYLMGDRDWVLSKGIQEAGGGVICVQLFTKRNRANNSVKVCFVITQTSKGIHTDTEEFHKQMTKAIQLDWYKKPDVLFKRHICRLGIESDTFDTLENRCCIYDFIDN